MSFREDFRALASYASSRILGRYRIRNICLSVTEKCNLKCRMCDLWKGEGIDLEEGLLEAVILDKSLSSARGITLTGGEPLMREDITALALKIRRALPGRTITISSNGTLTEKALELAGALGGRGIRFIISIDGGDSHDKVRGRPGALRRSLDTIRQLTERFPGVPIEAKFTITPWNHHDLLEAYRESRRTGIRFMAKLARADYQYTNRSGQGRSLELTKAQRECVVRVIRLLRNSFLRKGRLIDATYLTILKDHLNGGARGLPACRCVFGSVFVMANGDVFTCRRQGRAGNLEKESLSDAWRSEGAEKARRKHRAGRCAGCVSMYGLYN